MARRRSRDPQDRRKSRAEQRAEHYTWFFLVLIFALIFLAPEGSVPNWLVPFSGAIILVGSGLFQFRHRWRVSPITWLGGALMFFFTLVNFYSNPDANFLGPSLLTFALVIGFGIVTGET